MSEAEGDKLFKAAQKLTSASFLSFRLKSDWEQAGPLYEKAANNFRQAKAWDKARDAYEMAAKCSQRQGSPWHAAKELEKAADAAKNTEDLTLAVDYFKQAALAYREAGRAQTAADTLAKAARLIEDKNPQAAGELLAEAVDEVESEGKLALAGDLYRQTVGTYIRAKQYADSVGMLLRFAAACESTNAVSSQCKAYLAAIVVWLYAQDGQQSWAVYQNALEVDVFSQSEEAFAAEALFSAYRQGDADAVKNCITSRPTFFDLDNQVARLAKRLPQGQVESVAAGLGGADADIKVIEARVPKVSVDDIDENDLT